MIRFIMSFAVYLGFMTSTVAADQAQLKRGEYIFNTSGCKSCHTDTKNKGKLLAGGTPLATPFGTFYGPNITPDKTHGIGNWSDDDFVTAMREGIAPDGSHYFPVFPYTTFTKMSRQDMLDLKAYIFSLPTAAVPNKPHDVAFPFNIRFLQLGWKILFFDEGEYVADKNQSAEWNRGAYLVKAQAHCGECHTPRNIFGGTDNSRFLAGTVDGPEGDLAPNITPDPDTGIGKWSVGDLESLINIGMLPDGDIVGGSMTEVSENLANITPADLKAMVTFLMSVPPIHNKITPKK